MKPDKKSRELSGVLLSLLMVTACNAARIVTDCRNKSIRFSPAFIFARWARGPPKLVLRQPCLLKDLMRAGPL